MNLKKSRMKINNFEYLDEPVEHKGSKSLYPQLFPLGKRIFVAAISTEDKKEKSSLILDDSTKKALQAETSPTKVRLMVIAVGEECEKVEIGDYIIPDQGFFATALDRIMEDGAEFSVAKEQYVESIFKPKD